MMKQTRAELKDELEKTRAELKKTQQALYTSTLAATCELCPVKDACNVTNRTCAPSCAEVFLTEAPLLSRQ